MVPQVADHHPGDHLCVGLTGHKQTEGFDCLGESEGGQGSPGLKFRGPSTREHVMDRPGSTAQRSNGAFGRVIEDG